jgi:hypothetical protein
MKKNRMRILETNKKEVDEKNKMTKYKREAKKLIE